ncbi:MAG TPA: potassium-transporting ATPase subunit F [Acidimicrobiales bacterium]
MLGAGVTPVQGLLLGVSILVFIYLGIAMFKPEWF